MDRRRTDTESLANRPRITSRPTARDGSGEQSANPVDQSFGVLAFGLGLLSLP